MGIPKTEEVDVSSNDQQPSSWVRIKNTDLITQCIVFGFIRRIQAVSQMNMPSDVVKMCLLFFIPSQELLFPLTEDQLRLLTNPHHVKMLRDDIKYLGTIDVDEGVLKLKIDIDLPHVTAIHKLEKRLGVLMTVDEIKQIKDSICGEEKINIEENININNIDVLKMNDKDFFHDMMVSVERGVKFTKHKKRGIYDDRFLVIHNDRLYWKETQNGKNHRSRSMHLTKIIQVMIGKNTKALKHESLIDISPICCFSVVAKKATLDISTPNKNPVDVRKFTSYLKGLQRHFIFQQSQFMAQTQQNRDRHHNHHQFGKVKLSPIGQGFNNKFKFDDKTLENMSTDQ